MIHSTTQPHFCWGTSYIYPVAIKLHFHPVHGNIQQRKWQNISDITLGHGVLEYLEGDEQQYQPRGKSTLELMQPQPIKNIIFRDYAAYFGYDPIVHLLVIPKVLQARMIQFWQLSLKSPYNDKETFNFKTFLKLELFNVQIQLA